MTKENLVRAIIAGLFSTFTIGILTLLTYKTELGVFIIASFGSSMVLLYGYPESPFAQQKIFFWSSFILCRSYIFIFFTITYLCNYSFSSRYWCYFNDCFKCYSPTSGGNPIIVIIGSVSLDYLINPVILGSIIILVFGIILNRLI